MSDTKSLHPSPISEGDRLPIDRETLGRMVREAWVRWAKTQPSPKPSWLAPYDELSEPDKEADRQIGEAICKWTVIHCEASHALSRCGRDEAIEEAAKVADDVAEREFDKGEAGGTNGHYWKVHAAEEIAQSIRSLVSDDKERGSAAQVPPPFDQAARSPAALETALKHLVATVEHEIRCGRDLLASTVAAAQAGRALLSVAPPASPTRRERPSYAERRRAILGDPTKPAKGAACICSPGITNPDCRAHDWPFALQEKP